jgi:hypothetical protein
VFIPNNDETGFAALVFKDSVEVFTVLYNLGYALVPQWTIDSQNSGLPISGNPE